MKLYHTFLSDANAAYRPAIWGAFPEDVISFTTPKQSASVEIETQNGHGLRYLNSAIKVVNTLPSHNMQNFQGQLKKLLNHILSDFFPYHLVPSPSSLPALVMSGWRTQMKRTPKLSGNSSASSSTESASKPTSKLKDQDPETIWKK